MSRVEHTFPPFIREDSEILILGTMPSVKSREAGFYYMHPQNRFWRALFDVYSEPFSDSLDARLQLLIRYKIALFDVLLSCEITGSSDASIRDPVPNDIGALIKNSCVSRVFTTGKTALRLYEKYCEAGAGIKAEYLPSPSPANCALQYDRLLKAYKKALRCV